MQSSALTSSEPDVLATNLMSQLELAAQGSGMHFKEVPPSTVNRQHASLFDIECQRLKQQVIEARQQKLPAVQLEQVMSCDAVRQACYD